MLEEIRALEAGTAWLRGAVGGQEELFTKLGLCFRVLDMWLAQETQRRKNCRPTEELGAPAYRKYDMEARVSWRFSRGFWMPFVV